MFLNQQLERSVENLSTTMMGIDIIKMSSVSVLEGNVTT